ncbi:MAG: helix-turn-helix domain-containing protein [Chloroflexota bacterium]
MSPSTIRRLIRNNELAALRVGREYRIMRRDFETFLRRVSNRLDVRSAHFERVLAIADRNPGLSSDDVLGELEELDVQARHSATS